VLFAAGRGERLRPLTDVVPKPALPLIDAPLGAFGLSALVGACPPVVVNTSHRAALVRAALEAFAPPGAVEFTVERPRPLGTAETLRQLRERVTGTLVTHNADALTDLDLGALLAAHRRGGAPATLVGAPVARRADLLVAGLRAVELLDRRAEDRPGARFLGIAAFEPAALELLRAGGPPGLTEALLRPLIDAGEAAVFVHHGYALDVGTPERYLQAARDVRGGRVSRPARRSPGSTKRN
jgi:mannose-1-phosphate guanylyltransferase